MKTFKQTLEAIAKTPGKPGANTNYASNTLTGTSEYIGKFSKIKTNTKEGLAEYRNLTEQPTKGISDEKVAETYLQIDEELSERWDDWKDYHIAPITGELEKQTQNLIGYKFCPEETSSIKKYEKPREIVGTAKKTIETIEKDPKAYIEKVVAEAEDYMKGVVGRHPDKVCAIDARDEQNRAFAAIENYGSKKFVVDTYKHAKSAEKALEQEIKPLKEEGEKLAKAMPSSYDSEQKAAYFADINKRMTEIREKGSKLQDSKEIRETIVATAIRTLEEKANSPKTTN